MLSTDEIKQLTDYQVEVFKDVFATKDDIKDVKKSLNILQSSVDEVLKDKVTNDQERTVSNERVKELENWVGKAVPKIGIDFKH